MDKWVITYNEIGHGQKLIYDYETIEGKNAKDALKKTFGKEFNRLTGDAGRYAQIILVRGEYNAQKNRIEYNGRYQLLCYALAN